MVIIKNISNASKDFFFDDDENLLSVFLMDKQIIYIKGFTKNNISHCVAMMIEELKKNIDKDSEEVVVVYDGDNYNKDDFTLFIDEFCRSITNEGRKVHLLCEPSNENAREKDLPVGNVEYFLKLQPFYINTLESVTKVLQKYAIDVADKGFDIVEKPQNVKNDWGDEVVHLGNLVTSSGKPMEAWEYYKIKGMIMAHYLANIQLKYQIVVYCLGGGEAPKLEYNYIYNPSQDKLTSCIAGYLPLTEENKKKFKWYLSSCLGTHFRILNNCLKIEVSSLIKSFTVEIDGNGVVSSDTNKVDLLDNYRIILGKKELIDGNITLLGGENETTVNTKNYKLTK